MNLSPLVAAANLCKTYSTGEHLVRAVDDVSASFEAGTFTAIMGPSGSGKSTLMHCLAGLDSVTSGSVLLDGEELTGMNDRALTLTRRAKVGFIFQQYNLLPGLTLGENIRLPMRLAGLRPDPDHERALVQSLGLSDRLEHRPSELSGGQQQRAAIARALITKPAAIFADEPTGAVDSRTGTSILQYLRDCSLNEGQTIIMVTHDAHAAGFAQRIVVMSDGRLVEDLAAPTSSELRAIRERLDQRADR